MTLILFPDLLLELPHLHFCCEILSFCKFLLLSWMLCIFCDLFCALCSSMRSCLLFSTSCSRCCSDSLMLSCISLETEDNLSTSPSSFCIFFFCSSSFLRLSASSSTSVTSQISQVPFFFSRDTWPLCTPSLFSLASILALSSLFSATRPPDF